MFLLSNIIRYGYFFQGDKYKDHDPDALDLFKECHYSKKKEGYTPAVQLAIVRNYFK